MDGQLAYGEHFPDTQFTNGGIALKSSPVFNYNFKGQVFIF